MDKKINYDLDNYITGSHIMKFLLLSFGLLVGGVFVGGFLGPNGFLQFGGVIYGFFTTLDLVVILSIIKTFELPLNFILLFKSLVAHTTIFWSLFSIISFIYITDEGLPGLLFTGG